MGVCTMPGLHTTVPVCANVFKSCALRYGTRSRVFHAWSFVFVVFGYFIPPWGYGLEASDLQQCVLEAGVWKLWTNRAYCHAADRFYKGGPCFFGFLLLCLHCFSDFLLFCFSAYTASLIFCFSASLLFCFSAYTASLLFLLLCFSASLLFCFLLSLLLCFSAFVLSLLLCFSAFVLLRLSTSTLPLLLCSLPFFTVSLLFFFFASFSPVSATLRQIPGRPPKIWETDICQPITYTLDFFANYQKTRTNICCFSFFPVCLIKITPYNIHDTKYDSKNAMCLILRLLLSALYIYSYIYVYVCLFTVFHYHTFVPNTLEVSHLQQCAEFVICYRKIDHCNLGKGEFNDLRIFFFGQLSKKMIAASVVA